MLLAQDGYQRGDIIKDGLEKGLIEGAIFSPRYQSSDKLELVLKDCLEKYPDKTFFIDPQWYISSISASRIGQLSTYPYFRHQLKKTDYTSRNIQEYTKNTIDFQLKCNMRYIVSPGVIIPSFKSPWSQIALQLFIESTEFVKAHSLDFKTLLCLPILESALREDEPLNEFLDDISVLNADGFYIIIERSVSESLQWSDPITLSRLMYLVNALSQNDFEVFCGYTDLVGVILKAAGAKAIANGWWKNLKQFTRDPYLDQSGGRRPREKYTSEELLNSIFINPELQAISETEYADEAIGGSSFNSVLKANPLDPSWTRETSTFHHWEIINKLISIIDQVDDLNRRFELLNQKIDMAKTLYAKLKSSGVNFDPISGSAHLNVWGRAITLFNQFQKEI